MYSGPHIIFSKIPGSDAPLCLGIDRTNDPPTLQLQTFSESRYDQSWLLAPIPTNFDDTAYFLKHMDTGLCPHFGQSGAIPIEKIDPTSKEYVMRLEVIRDGFVSICNHDRTNAMDASGNNPGIGTDVVAWRTSKTLNEQWIFVSTALYAAMPR